MSDYLSENDLMAAIISNTKRKNRTIDLLTLAKYLDILNLKYSSKILAKELGLSEEMIRQLLLPLQMPKEIQNLISSRKIDKIDVVVTLNKIRNKEKQIEAANLLTNYSAREIRDIINLYQIKKINLTMAKDIITQYKNKNLHIILIDLDDKTYNDLNKISKKYSINLPEFSKLIIISWVDGKINEVNLK
jgi:hypothetical protein